MNGGVMGGGVIFVIAALLWAAVLVPSWLRRREFRAAERNALRLQRTLRVLAETSEVPEEIRLEATAKEALAHEKILRSARKQLDAERAASVADARAEQVQAEIRAQQMKRKERAAVRSSWLRRPLVRRVRATAALGALMGMLTMLVGVGIVIAGVGPAALVWGLLVTLTSMGALVLLAPGRGRAKVLPVELEVCDEAAQLPAQLTQVVEPLPADNSEALRLAQQAAAERIERARALARARAAKPVSRENQDGSMLLGEPGAAAAAAVRAGSREPRTLTPEPRAQEPQQQDLRQQGAQVDPAAESTQQRRQAPRIAQPRYTPQEEAARARLSQMGVVGDTSEGMPNLDDVLRRRRIG